MNTGSGFLDLDLATLLQLSDKAQSTRRKCRGLALSSANPQRTRWPDGRVIVWLGARKQTGRGEGSSGLAFDRLVIAPASQA